ncbi:unnamed protein product [Tilletia controversa]|uniref:Uncharacterized protein n=1 Tax=Tilletia controversa TaxID=13291 RepID=A0A8X7MIN1_9BASI|nr:hypothetical protein A4X06_0g9232 [Tilletia controversa]CAD6914559.1 unnamed protein product [Tilletia controversa]
MSPSTEDARGTSTLVDLNFKAEDALGLANGNTGRRPAKTEDDKHLLRRDTEPCINFKNAPGLGSLSSLDARVGAREMEVLADKIMLGTGTTTRSTRVVQMGDSAAGTRLSWFHHKCSLGRSRGSPPPLPRATDTGHLGRDLAIEDGLGTAVVAGRVGKERGPYGLADVNEIGGAAET